MELQNIFFICYLLISASATLSPFYVPFYLTPCPSESEVCLKKSIQDVIPKLTQGVPEIGIGSLDPLLIKHADVKLHDGVRTVVTNGIVTGLRKCLVEAAKFDVDKDILDLELQCNITLRGKYKAYGKILIVWLNGDGYAKIKARNVKITARIFFQDEIRNGELYYVAKDLSVTHSYDGTVRSQISNLFKGNQELSDFILNFLNDNWRQVVEEFGNPIATKLTEMVFQVIKQFFVSIPKSKLFVDWDEK